MSSLADIAAKLIAHLRRVQTLESVMDVLGWDEQVNLPAGGAELRAEQQATLAEVAHAAASDPRAGEWIARLTEAEASLTADQRAVVAQARRDYDRATKLPADFVREKAVQASRGYHVWAAARAANDFGRYAPVLEKNLELARREAVYLGRTAAPYDYFLDYNDPGMTAATIERLFAELSRDLVPLARAIAAASAARPGPVRLDRLPEEAQRGLVREITTRLGFDYNRGRIDVSLHPFCSGTGEDVRMTTRFREDEPLDALFSAIHETGHGLYEQGLPASWRGTALGLHAGMAVHESQSRLWENQVARSRGFWRYFEPRLRALFPDGAAGLGSEELYRTINAVAPMPIRVEADEVTYNLHIILRFQLERRLFAGTLAVADLPAAWTVLARELLGLTPADDREGVLQDVHWSGGAFGYFPSYCLGNLIAAQLWERALELRPDLEEDFARGDFGWLLAWLRENVHASGRRHDALTLTRGITGKELSPRPLMMYLNKRYGEIYLR